MNEEPANLGELKELRSWLASECERRNLTWREASIRAGVNPGAISAVMTGSKPGLQMCISLAESFDVAPEYVLRLAGHLPPANSDPMAPLAAQRMRQMAKIFAKLPDDIQEELTGALLEFAKVCVLIDGER